MSPVKSPYVIFGCGYTGSRLAQALLADGVPVRAYARRPALLAPLQELGAEVHYLDAAKPRQFGPALRGLPAPVVVYSIPGVPSLPVGEAVRRAADAAVQAGASAFIYLSTTGVYGRSSIGDNDEWVDESSSIDPNDPEMTSRLADEAAVAAASQTGLRAVTLRLSAIYGPPLWPGQNGRGVRQRMRKGEYRLWDGGRYYFSRIHVDDIVTVIRAAADRAGKGSLYVVGDDHPCPQGEYGRWLAAHLNLPEPQSADSLAPSGPRQMIRGRRLSNRLVKEQLGITLRYPSYQEGEAQIDTVEATAASDPPATTGPAPAGPATMSAAAAGPATTSPALAGPATMSAAAAGPATTSPASTGPATTSPAPAGPATTAPTASPSPAGAQPTTTRTPDAAPGEALTAPGWPFSLRSGVDLGTQLGLDPVHVEMLQLAPAARAQPGCIYLILAGHPVVEWNGQRVILGPHDLVPPTAALHGPEQGPEARAALILALQPPQGPSTH